jgi:hypothetical protein
MSAIFGWQERFGLLKWSLVRSTVPSKYMAEGVFERYKSHKIAKIKIGTDWKSTEPSDDNISSVACHEVLHVLLYDLIEYAREHPYDSAGIMEKEHEVINALERAIHGPLK